jgi:hypothetical protein
MTVALAFTGCASPAARTDQEATELGFNREIVDGTGFLHVVYRHSVSLSPGPVHVYIEHDGLPWLTETIVSPDPTPRNPVMLRLMALDPAPSVYLGRPCYFGLAQSAPCSPLLWTHERYSERVVESMAAALRQVLPDPKSQVVFLGNSGGGTLAMLLAERFADTRAVVTLAGNLDIAAWAQYHGYTPLQGSLNPAFRAPLDRKVIQKHYVGGRDRNVPPFIARRFAQARPGAEVIELPDCDHRCCWETLWPQVLADLNRELGQSGDTDDQNLPASSTAEAKLN